MRPDDLIKPDLFSEVMFVGAGAFILVILIVAFVFALAPVFTHI